MQVRERLFWGLKFAFSLSPRNCIQPPKGRWKLWIPHAHNSKVDTWKLELQPCTRGGTTGGRRGLQPPIGKPPPPYKIKLTSTCFWLILSRQIIDSSPNFINAKLNQHFVSCCDYFLLPIMWKSSRSMVSAPCFTPHCRRRQPLCQRIPGSTPTQDIITDYFMINLHS